MVARKVLLMDNLESIAQIWVNLAESFRVSQKDIDVFLTRTHCEGIIFVYDYLTILGRAITASVISGAPLQNVGRFGLKRDTKLPEFLYKHLRGVFEKDGRLRVDASPQNIKQLRQLTLLCYKVEVQYGNDAVNKAISSFIDRDTGLVLPIEMGTQGGRRSGDRCSTSRICRIACSLIQRVLQQCDPLEIRPRHGSGATSDGTPNCDKYHGMRFIPNLNKVFEYSTYFFHNDTHLCDELNSLLDADVYDVPCSKLVAVPKDRRGPRLICCEPREHMFIQQGLMRKLYQVIERHPLTRGQVNFTDQTINQRLARESSILGNYSTIDLKDASDRVRWDLVQRLFPGNWVEAFEACRTDMVKLPNSEIPFGPMRKFAPMGSAVCFPVEALVFWSLLQAALNCDVYVYGDDIIVPIDKHELAVHTLESFDLKVNVDKSCHLTPFRESCGGDYYCGYDVSYVKLRTEVADTIESEVSLVEFANNISGQYGDMVGKRIQSVVDGLYGPHYHGDCAYGLNYTDGPAASNDVFFVRRFHRTLHRVEYLLPVVKSSTEGSRVDPRYHWGELYRRELEGAPTDPLWGKVDFKLGHYATPGCTKKYRWRAA